MTDSQGPKQRLRIEFGKAGPLQYISHLDLARAWERVLRRAGLPLAYSQGFNPRLRFQIAAALPVGVNGWAELLDVWLDGELEVEEVMARLRPNLPPGLTVAGVSEVDLRAPSLQSLKRAADYRVVIRSREAAEAIRTRLEGLLEAATLPRQRHHKGRLQAYDLRPLIQELAIEPGRQGEQILTLRLQASPQGAGRPDEVLDALGLSVVPHTMERTKLHFEFDK
jgi:radical SAM-linked protein